VDDALTTGGGLTHIDSAGEAHMVDVGGKTPTCRTARVGARVWMAPATMDMLKRQAFPKGDVLEVARVAGIAATLSRRGVRPHRRRGEPSARKPHRSTVPASQRLTAHYPPPHLVTLVSYTSDSMSSQGIALRWVRGR